MPEGTVRQLFQLLSVGLECTTIGVADVGSSPRSAKTDGTMLIESLGVDHEWALIGRDAEPKRLELTPSRGFGRVQIRHAVTHIAGACDQWSNEPAPKRDASEVTVTDWHAQGCRAALTGPQETGK